MTKKLKLKKASKAAIIKGYLDAAMLDILRLVDTIDDYEIVGDDVGVTVGVMRAYANRAEQALANLKEARLRLSE